MKMKATLTGEIKAPEAEITFPEGNLSGDIVNEGALAGVIGIQEVGVDVTVNSTGDKVISFADPGALKFSGPFVAELEMDPREIFRGNCLMQQAEFLCFIARGNKFRNLSFLMVRDMVCCWKI